MSPRRYLAAVALAGLLAACGGDDDGGGDASAPPSPTATATAEAPQEPVVDMTDSLVFEPKEITVKVGDSVEWRNVGNIAHTVTTTPSKVADPERVSVPSGAKPWDSGLIGGDETFSRTFDEPGTYEYVCIPHEGADMVGTVVVEE
jgi:plastocyanin